MADWKDFEIGPLVPVTVTDTLSTGIQTTSTVVNAGLQVLRILKVFLNVESNPLTASIKLLLNEIQQLIDNVQNTSVNGLFIVPKKAKDMANFKGGFGKFSQQVVSSFYDINDADRPRFGPSGTLGGVVLYIQQPNAATLIRQLMALYAFFNRDLDVSYPAPVDLQIQPADSFGDPLDSALLSIFEQNGPTPEKLFLSWREPRIANDVFLDIFGQNKFYIERSKKREGQIVTREATSAKLKDPIERQLERKYNDEGKIPDVATNSKGEPVAYWEPIDHNDPFFTVRDALDDLANAKFNFIAGSYGIVLDDIDPGIENGFYYRVRSVPKDADLVRKPAGPQGNQNVYQLSLDGDPYTESRPSTPKFGFIPDIDTSFDLPSAIMNTYRAAYLLRFDQEVYGSSGASLLGSESVEPTFLQSVIDTSPEAFEKYSFSDPSGASLEVSFFTEPLIENPELFSYTASVEQNNEDLVTDPEAFDPFGGVDEYLAPGTNQPANERVRRTIDSLTKQKIKKLVPFLSANDSLFELFRSLYDQASTDMDLLLTNGQTEADFLDNSLRAFVFQALQLLEGNVQPGTPPNWEALNLLEDLIPDGDALFNQLFGLINSLDNIIQNTVSEFQGTIDGIEDRLRILTSIIDAIDLILSALEEINQLGPDIDFLWIPPLQGGTKQFISEFLGASNEPDRNPDSFYSGIVLAFGSEAGSGVTGVANALKLIFGV